LPHLNLTPLSRPSEAVFVVLSASASTGSSSVTVVDSTVVVVPCTVRLPEITTLSVSPLPRAIAEPLTFKLPSMTVLPVAPATVKLADPTSKSVVTVRSLVIVTSFGNPTCNVTSVPDLVTAVFTSFVVPIILKSSVNKSTSCVAEPSESIVRAVATATWLAAVNLPCWSTVKVGICCCTSV
jgi:hypothetical protein